MADVLVKTKDWSQAQYYTGIECIWIMANIAACGSVEIVHELFYNQLVDSVQSEPSPVLQLVKRFICSNVTA